MIRDTAHDCNESPTQAYVAVYSCPSVWDRFIGMKVNFFMLDWAPKSFNEYIITPGAFAVHADPDAVVFEQPGECIDITGCPDQYLLISGIP